MTVFPVNKWGFIIITKKMVAYDDNDIGNMIKIQVTTGKGWYQSLE